MYVCNVFYHILFNYCVCADCLWEGRVFLLIHIDGVLNSSRYIIMKMESHLHFSQNISPIQENDVDCDIFCCQVSVAML